MAPGCFLPPKKSDTHGEVHFDVGFKSEISQKFDLVPFSLFKNYVKWHQDVFCPPKNLTPMVNFTLMLISSQKFVLFDPKFRNNRVLRRRILARAQSATKFWHCISEIDFLLWNSIVLITKMSILSSLNQNCGSLLLGKIIYVVKFSDFWLIINFHNFDLNCLKLTKS